jgi:hypothetical protein
MTLDGFRQNPLVKCIRANLMLPWISGQLGARVVLVVRHPGAVIESELRGGWNAGYALDRFRTDPQLHFMTSDRYRSLLARKLSPVEALTLRWVIENQWVMEAASTNGISVIHYEHLRSASDSAWLRTCAALDLAERPAAKILTRPSQQSGSRRRSIPLEQSSKPRWMSGLDAHQTLEIEGILDAVSFTRYVMHEPNPILPDATGNFPAQMSLP